jgi:hypothetical protein
MKEKSETTPSLSPGEGLLSLLITSIDGYDL